MNNIYNKKITHLLKYKELFHKYFLKLSDPESEIKYEIIKTSNSISKKKKKLYTHLHCYNIDLFDEIYDKYILNILEYFSIILTYSIGKKIPKYDITILKIPNKGLDIGAKIIVIDYLYSNDLHFESILMLHSKKCKYKRNLYFKFFIDSISHIKYLVSIYNKYDLIIPDIILSIKDYPINELYLDQYNQYNNLSHLTDIFVEGNCFMISSCLIYKIFPKKKLKLYYNILNTSDTFDYNCVKQYYKLNCVDISQIYETYKTLNLLPNYKHFKNPQDGGIEHMWERIWINTTLNISGKYLILSKDKYKENSEKCDNIFIIGITKHACSISENTILLKKYFISQYPKKNRNNRF